MLLVDGLLKRLAGTLAGQDAGQALAELPATAHTKPLARFDFQEAVPLAPVLVPDQAPEHPFAAQLPTLAVRARLRPDIPGRNPHLSPSGLDSGNLKSGQAYQDL